MPPRTKENLIIEMCTSAFWGGKNEKKRLSPRLHFRKAMGRGLARIKGEMRRINVLGGEESERPKKKVGKEVFSAT